MFSSGYAVLRIVYEIKNKIIEIDSINRDFLRKLVKDNFPIAVIELATSSAIFSTFA